MCIRKKIREKKTTLNAQCHPAISKMCLKIQVQLCMYAECIHHAIYYTCTVFMHICMRAILLLGIIAITIAFLCNQNIYICIKRCACSLRGPAAVFSSVFRVRLMWLAFLRAHDPLRFKTLVTCCDARLRNAVISIKDRLWYTTLIHLL